MKKYLYFGITEQNKEIRSVINAEDRRDAIQKLKDKGNIKAIIDLREIKNKVDYSLIIPVVKSMFLKFPQLLFYREKEKNSLGFIKLFKKENFNRLTRNIEELNNKSQKPNKEDQEEKRKKDFFQHFSEIFSFYRNSLIISKENVKRGIVANIEKDLSYINYIEDGKKIALTDTKKIYNPLSKIKIPEKQVIFFTKRLQSLLSAGILLHDALQSLKESSPKKMSKIIEFIINETENGTPLSTALATFPKQFDELYVALVAVGEESGTLEKCLGDIVEFKEKKNKLKRKIKGAMIYPTIILIIINFALLLGSIFFIPPFKDMFTDMNIEMPALTKTVFNIADNLPYIYLGIFVVIGFFAIMKQAYKPFGYVLTIIKDRVVFKIPLVNKFVLASSMLYFSKTMSLLLSNGIRLSYALRFTRNTIKNTFIRVEIEEIEGLVLQGIGMHEAITKQEHFDSLIANIVNTGEKSGKLPQSLLDISKIYEEMLDEYSTTIESLVQPIFILIIAAIITPVLFAVLLPMFDITSGAAGI